MRGGQWPRSADQRLWRLCPARRQHAEPPTEIGVPDVVGRIDCDAKGAPFCSRQTKFRYFPFSESTEFAGTKLGKPNRPVGSGSQRGKSSRGGGKPEFGEPSLRKPSDLVGAQLEKPHRSALIHGDIAKSTVSRRQI